MTSSGQAIQILLVEDDDDHAELALRVFEKCGVTNQVMVVKNGQDALDAILGAGAYAGQGIADTLKLILLDLNLPKISGADVILQLRKNPKTRAIAIAVLSISGQERDILDKEPYAIQLYLRKPLELHAFLNLYRDYIKSPKS